MGSTGPTRRAVVAAALLVPLSACTAGGSAPDGRPGRSRAAPDPDAPLREAAAARERDLLAAYDRALAATGVPAYRRTALLAVRGEHERHLAGLVAAAPGTPATAPAGSPASTAPPTGPGPDLPGLEAAAATAHAAAVPAATRPLAGLLASLAASEAAHVVALGVPG